MGDMSAHENWAELDVEFDDVVLYFQRQWVTRSKTYMSQNQDFVTQLELASTSVVGKSPGGASK